MKNTNNKIKEKIEKLLNLSMSDNEHEASIALEKALKLMSENNLTREDIYKQNFIQKKYETNYYRMPDWLARLYSYMASCSGCLFTWQNGDSSTMRKAYISFTGRERDVENAVYLSEFLKREIEKRAKIYKNEIDEIYTPKYKNILIKSFRVGLIEKVKNKIKEQQKSFFNASKETSNSKDIVPIDTRFQESCDYFKNNIANFKINKTQAKYEAKGMVAGYENGEDIEINQAVARQDTIKQLGL